MTRTGGLSHPSRDPTASGPGAGGPGPKPSRYSLMSAAEVFNHPISCMSASDVKWLGYRRCSCVDRDVRGEPRAKSLGLGMSPSSS